MIKVYPNKLCKGCGACCKLMPGIFSPDDIRHNGNGLKHAVTDMLRSGLYSVDYRIVDEDLRTDIYYLRPATLAGKGMALHSSAGGQCVFLIDRKGCILPHDRRPYQCRKLIQQHHKGKTCYFEDAPGENGKEIMARMWIPYRDTLMEAINEVGVNREEDELLQRRK